MAGEQISNNCRICVKSLDNCPINENCCQVIDSCIADKIISIVPTFIKFSDGFPEKICCRCCQKIDEFLEFQDLIRNSDEALQSMLQQQRVEEKNSNVKVESVDTDFDYLEIAMGNGDNSDGNLTKHEAIIFPSTDGLQVWEVQCDSETTHVPEKPNDEENTSGVEVLGSSEPDESNVIDSSSKVQKTKVRRFHKCTRCEQMFLHARDLRTHLEKHKFEEEEEKKVMLPDGTLKCQLCFKSFEKVSELKTHVYSHFLDQQMLHETEEKEAEGTVETPDENCEGKQKYPCAYCAKSFKTKAQYIVHIREHVVKHQVRSKSYKCPHCDKSFSKRSELRYHKGSHVDSPMVCTVCQKKFKNVQSLSIHSRRHTQGLSFKCQTCGKSYYTNSELMRHIQLHAGVRDFVCSLCPASFLSKPELNRHLKYHKGIKKFKCDICSKSYFESGHLKIHYRVHTGERPWCCDVCPKAFITRSKLLRHSRTHFRT